MQLFNLLALLASCLHLAQSSIIRFTASPTVIKAGLTSSLSLHCALNDTSASSNIIGKRDVTETAENVAEVTTIVIMRDGTDMAAISRSSAARVMDGSTNVRVSGSVAGRSGNLAFLQVDIQDPLSSQQGEFVCEINAVRVVHAVTFSTSLEVVSEEPSVEDLALSIHQLKVNERLMQQTIANLTSTIAGLRQTSGASVFFSSGLSADRNVATGQVVVYDKVYANEGSAYSPTTGLFTCPTGGFYHFEMSAMAQVGSSAFRLRLYKNQQKDFSIAATHSYNGATNSGILKLAKGDVVKVVSEQNGHWSHLHSYDGGIYTTFNGQLVARA